MDGKKTIGVPSIRGMGNAFGDFGIGAIGGFIFALSQAFLGTGIVGALAAPVIVGSMVKGPRGTALSTVAGFMALSNIFSGFGAEESTGASEETL